jgi:hypothetical protein
MWMLVWINEVRVERIDTQYDQCHGTVWAERTDETFDRDRDNPPPLRTLVVFQR